VGALLAAPLASMRVVEAGSVAVVVDVAEDEMPDFGSSSDSDDSLSKDSATSLASDRDSSVSRASPRMRADSSASPSSSSSASLVAGPSELHGAEDSASHDTDSADDETYDEAAAAEQAAFQAELDRARKDTSALTKAQRLVGFGANWLGACGKSCLGSVAACLVAFHDGSSFRERGRSIRLRSTHSFCPLQAHQLIRTT
jgi:hypothetical protein